MKVTGKKNLYETAAEKWWDEHGFTVVPEHRFLTKTVYRVRKDKKELTYDIPFCITDMEGFMEGFMKLWKLC